jgi:pyruvate/2-oxoglutarate dehydrogenase complex dihydrolipoamide dehydrogenase (E3) component
VRVTVELDQAPEVNADELAVAVGRHPRTDDLGLETVGLEPGNWIDLDDQLRATAVEGDWLYAVGDVNARALLTHISKYQARVAADNILGKSAAATADGARSPRVLCCLPHLPFWLEPHEPGSNRLVSRLERREQGPK